MAELMAEADMAIGAGGSTVWERCCVGVPSLSLSMAENQRRQVADAAAAGLLYTPDPNKNLVDLIERHARALMENGVMREALSRCGMKTVDGLGVLRVLKLLAAGDMKIRRVSKDDMRNVFEWRNHPDIRRVSRSNDAIDWKTHKEWFASLMSNPDRIMLIGYCGDRSVGVVRYEIQGECAEVSIYIVPEMRLPGSGQELMKCAERWLRENRPDVRRIAADVLADNGVSHRLFSKCGYEIESIHYTKRQEGI
jgi:RimJ/RimL family protein N-acetyltransferase